LSTVHDVHGAYASTPINVKEHKRQESQTVCTPEYQTVQSYIDFVQIEFLSGSPILIDFRVYCMNSLQQQLLVFNRSNSIHISCCVSAFMISTTGSICHTNSIVRKFGCSRQKQATTTTQLQSVVFNKFCWLCNNNNNNNNNNNYNKNNFNNNQQQNSIISKLLTTKTKRRITMSSVSSINSQSTDTKNSHCNLQMIVMKSV
jgi:hypothetical protein